MKVIEQVFCDAKFILTGKKFYWTGTSKLFLQ